MNTHVYRVELAEAARPGYRISLRSVTGLDVKTGKEIRFRGKLFSDLGLPAFNPTDDRVMICGSPQMLKDLKRMLEERGFMEGNTTKQGDFVIERAFVEQ